MKRLSDVGESSTGDGWRWIVSAVFSLPRAGGVPSAASKPSVLMGVILYVCIVFYSTLISARSRTSCGHRRRLAPLNAQETLNRAREGLSLFRNRTHGTEFRGPSRDARIAFISPLQRCSGYWKSRYSANKATTNSMGARTNVSPRRSARPNITTTRTQTTARA